MNGRKFLAAVAENWPAKVLSIALALILFVFHYMSTLKERFFSVPLNVELNNNMVPASAYPRMIRLSIRGDQNSIDPILEDDIEAYLDLTKHTSAGVFRAPVQVRKKGTALGVEPLEIRVDPLEISLELDQKSSRTVSVSPAFNGSPGAGYTLVSYILEPSQVVIDGPQKLVKAVPELSTETIDLSERNEDFSLILRILNQDPLLVIRGNGMAEFQGMVREQVLVQSFENIPIVITGLPDTFIAEPEVRTGSIRIGGSQDDLREFTPPEGLLTLDCSAIDREGNFEIPVLVNLPLNYNLARCDPKSVMVKISVAGETAIPGGQP